MYVSNVVTAIRYLSICHILLRLVLHQPYLIEPVISVNSSIFSSPALWSMFYTLMSIWQQSRQSRQYANQNDVTRVHVDSLLWGLPNLFSLERRPCRHTPAIWSWHWIPNAEETAACIPAPVSLCVSEVCVIRIIAWWQGWRVDYARCPVTVQPQVLSDLQEANYKGAMLVLCQQPSQQTQNICIMFVQCWTNVEDAGPTLYKCYTNVLCLLG